jgi:predicted CXXCH cytochrome family protein
MARSTRPLNLLLTLALLSAVQVPAFAQHDDISVTTPERSSSGCVLCHASHDAGPTVKSLRIDPLVASEYSAAGLSPASLSCLRCHSTWSARLRQPEYVNLGVAPSPGGKLFGTYLQDDHPVGEASRPGLPMRGDDADPWSSSVGIGSVVPSPGTHVPECNTCHDPHSRNGLLIAPEEEHFFCGACHDRTQASSTTHTNVPCTGCHALHNASSTKLLAEHDVDRLCLSCHTAAGVPSLSRNYSERRAELLSMLAVPRTNMHGESRSDRCTGCHLPH